MPGLFLEPLPEKAANSDGKMLLLPSIVCAGFRSERSGGHELESLLANHATNDESQARAIDLGFGSILLEHSASHGRLCGPRKTWGASVDGRGRRYSSGKRRSPSFFPPRVFLVPLIADSSPFHVPSPLSVLAPSSDCIPSHA